MNSLNFLREKPTENWIDHFVDRDKFLQLLNCDDHERIAALMNQFVVQAQMADKENDLNRRKEVDLRLELPREVGDEDFNYGRRKASQLWLCALACFASIEWNIDVARAHCNVLVIQTLLNRLVTFVFCLRNANLGDDVSQCFLGNAEGFSTILNSRECAFVAWLYARWILNVDTKDRMLDTVFKPTVSNPANQLDANLMLAEQLRACAGEIRQKARDAQVLLDRMANEITSIFIVLTKECFLEDVKDDESLLNLENNADYSAIFVPKLLFGNRVLTIANVNWRLMTRYLLMCDYFAAGRMLESKKQLVAITTDWPSREASDPFTTRFTEVSHDLLVGYCSAFEVPCPRGNGAAKKFFSFRHRPALNSTWRSGSIECVLEEYMRGLPATSAAVAGILSSTRDFPYFTEKFAEEICAPSSSIRRKTFCKVTLRFFALQQAAFAQFVSKYEKEKNVRLLSGYFKQVTRKSVSRIPDASKVMALLNGSVPFWRLIMSHDVNEIKHLLQQIGGKFTHPYRYEVSKVIGDAVLPKVMNLPNYEYIFLLLGKLENLARIGDMQRINLFCTECVKELYAIGKESEVQLRFAFDFVRVKLENWHEKTYKSTSNEHVLKTTQDLQKTVKAIVQTALVKSSVAALSKMMVHIVSFFINTNEWDYLMKCSDKLRSPFLDVAKVLAAFITADQPRAKKIADGPWWQIMHPTFEDYSGKRRYDGSSNRESAKQLISRTDFLLLLKNIMEPRSIAFLLSFLGKMYNSVLSLSASPEGLTGMFIEHNQYWQLAPSSYTNFSATYISECLECVLSNALLLNPINAFWLRSCADYYFVNERYEDALTLYMETCVACSESLIQPLPDNVVDDLMWLKIQRCLRYCGFETLAMMVCQQMRDPTDYYVPSAKGLVESEGSTLDACTAYFPLVSSMDVAEFLNESYEKLGLTIKAQSLLKGVAVPEMNSSNPNQNERFRRRERIMRLLCSHVLRIHL